MHDFQSVRSADRTSTNVSIKITGADARAVMDLLHYAIKRENLTRSRNGKTRISYQIKTSAGWSGQAEGMGQETASISS